MGLTWILFFHLFYVVLLCTLCVQSALKPSREIALYVGIDSLSLLEEANSGTSYITIFDNSSKYSLFQIHAIFPNQSTGVLLYGDIQGPRMLEAPSILYGLPGHNNREKDRWSLLYFPWSDTCQYQDRPVAQANNALAYL